MCAEGAGAWAALPPARASPSGRGRTEGGASRESRRVGTFQPRCPPYKPQIFFERKIKGGSRRF